MKKLLLTLFVLAVLIAGGAYFRYTSTLNASKQSAQTIENRAVTEEAFLEQREKTQEAANYREEQAQAQREQVAIEQEMEAMQDTPEPPQPIAQGTFNTLDRIHYANGSVEVITDETDAYIIFSDDFSTPNGPDLYVLLSQNSSDQYNEATALNLGPLTANNGQQIYKVPLEEFSQYNGSVKIWCRAFDVMFSVAELSDEQ